MSGSRRGPVRGLAPRRRRLIVAPAVAVTLDLSRFRFRNDDGTEVTATWAEAEDTDMTRPALTTFRLRFQVDATGNPSARAYKAEFELDGDPASEWEAVNP